MTTIALAQIVHETPAFLRRVGTAFANFFAGIEEARALAVRYETLSRMSDEELTSRGLSRSQIPQAVLDHNVRA